MPNSTTNATTIPCCETNFLHCTRFYTLLHKAPVYSSILLINELDYCFNELCHQCLNVESYNKIFHHYNFTVKMKKPNSADWVVTMYFGEVKQMFGRNIISVVVWRQMKTVLILALFKYQWTCYCILTCYLYQVVAMLVRAKAWRICSTLPQVGFIGASQFGFGL